MSDKRKQVRHETTARLSVIDVNTGSLVGELANISSDGFMVLTQCPPSVNSVFQLSLALPEVINGADTLYFGAESLWCSDTEEPGHFWVGFHLIDISPQDQQVLARFLESM